MIGRTVWSRASQVRVFTPSTISRCRATLRILEWKLDWILFQNYRDIPARNLIGAQRCDLLPENWSNQNVASPGIRRERRSADEKKPL